MRFGTNLKEALPGAAGILFWVLPVWFIGFLTVMGRLLIESAALVSFSWLYVCFLIAYVTRNRRKGGPSETLKEKGMYIRGGVLRR